MALSGPMARLLGRHLSPARKLRLVRLATSLQNLLSLQNASYKAPFAVFFSFCVTPWCCEQKKSIGNMQALGLFSRRAILGRSNKSSVVLEKIAKENSLNRIGAVSFNKYGKQDGIGFLPCSDKFVDSFLLYVYVPDYFVTARKTYTEVVVVSMRIRTLLKRHGLQKCKVKVLSPLKEVVKPKDLEKVYGRCKSRETDKTVYYVQEFRVSWQVKSTPLFSSF